VNLITCKNCAAVNSDSGIFVYIWTSVDHSNLRYITTVLQNSRLSPITLMPSCFF